MADTPDSPNDSEAANPAQQAHSKSTTPVSRPATAEADCCCAEAQPADLSRRRFITQATAAVGGLGVAATALPFLSSMAPSAKARAAGAPVEVDLSALGPGEQMTVEWRGKPVWIVRRKQAHLDKLHEHEPKLRDPQSKVDQQPQYARNRHRALKEEYLILVGICTHLGCSPKYKPELGELGPEWPGGFFCPCHGSTFDLAGRVFKGVPAPINMEVPPHRYLSPTQVLIGEDHVV